DDRAVEGELVGDLGRRRRAGQAARRRGHHAHKHGQPHPQAYSCSAAQHVAVPGLVHRAPLKGYWWGRRWVWSQEKRDRGLEGRAIELTIAATAGQEFGPRALVTELVTASGVIGNHSVVAALQRSQPLPPPALPRGDRPDPPRTALR